MQMRRKAALVLAGGLPQIRLIKELQNRSYYVILADYTEHPIAEPFADKFYRESTLDVEAIRKIAVKEQVEMIITCCTDQALETAARLSGELDLPCYIGADTGLAVTNKQYMKEIFEKNGIPTARHMTVNSMEFHCDLPYPLVVKPADCNSSKGVVKVLNDSQLKKAVGDALKLSRTGTAVIEEFIEGNEVSVDLFVCGKNAKIICCSFSEKIRDRQKFVIYKGQYPARLKDSVMKQIEDAAQKITDVFHLNNCPMLIQLLQKQDHIYIVEFSARTGGCVKYHMIEAASGIDVIKLTVDAFEGKEVDVRPSFYPGVVVNEFIYCSEGVFDHMENVGECLDNGLLEAAFVLKNPGVEFEHVESSADRIAAITFVADSYEEYVKKHNQAISRIKVISADGRDIMRHDLLPELD